MHYANLVEDKIKNMAADAMNCMQKQMEAFLLETRNSPIAKYWGRAVSVRVSHNRDPSTGSPCV